MEELEIIEQELEIIEQEEDQYFDEVGCSFALSDTTED